MTWEHWTIAGLWFLGGFMSTVIGQWEQRAPWFDLVIMVGWPFVAIFALASALIETVMERIK